MRAQPAHMTNGIVVAAALAFAGALLTGTSAVFAYAAGFIPARLVEPGLLAGVGLPIPPVPVWLTPISSGFVHAGWLHLIFNLMTLLFCGRQVEEVLGGRLLLLLYIVGAYAAAAGQWALAPHSTVPMIGASGAISAIIGAYALIYSNQEVRAIGPVPAYFVRMLWLGAGWIAIQGMIAIAGMGGIKADGIELGQIAIGAHIGGFVAGMAMTRPLLRLRFRLNGAGD